MLKLRAAGGNRTRTVSLQLDFKSSASTSSATAANSIFGFVEMMGVEPMSNKPS